MTPKPCCTDWPIPPGILLICQQNARQYYGRFCDSAAFRTFRQPNPNFADLPRLKSAALIGDVRAQQIMKARENGHLFSSAEELAEYFESIGSRLGVDKIRGVFEFYPHSEMN